MTGLVAGALSLALRQSQNFEVFAQASRDLLLHQDLYVRRAADYFKYSPTFALLFVPFAWIPAWLSAPLWGLLNMAVLHHGIDQMFEATLEKQKALTLTLLGTLLAMDGDQTNPLVAGLFLLSFVWFERASQEQGARALGVGALLTAAGAFIKLFPIVGGVFVLFGRRRGLGLALLFVSGALLFALPLVILRPSELVMEYASWRALVERDHGNRGWCLMTLLETWFSLPVAAGWVQRAGGLCMAVPVGLGLLRGTSLAWRRDLVCALLVFAVLFNHRTEYATFVLSAAAAGVYFATRKLTPLRIVLAFLLVVAPGPFYARPEPGWSGFLSVFAAHRLFHPLRVVPLTVFFGVLLVELLRPAVRAKTGSVRPG